MNDCSDKMENIFEDFEEFAPYYIVSQIILFESAEWLIYFYLLPKERDNNQRKKEKVEERIK